MALKRTLCILIFGFISFTICINNTFSDDYEQITALIDLRTTYSDGSHDLDFIIKLAKQRGFDAVFFNDHDRMAMEYGIFPFRNVFRKREERSSINSNGTERYFEDIERASLKHPDIIVVPGCETAPFYYWTGSPLKGNLTAHNWERHLLIMGMEDPQDYKNLPILHNGFSSRYFKQLFPASIIFLALFCLGLFLVFKNGYYRIIGIVILINSTLMLVDYHPFKSSLFNQYSGDRGYLPYQEVIDYVRNKGGMTFWTHPEARAGANVKKGPITAATLPHPEALLMTEGYTGFATLYGTWITMTEPGREWDSVLLEYCRGKRDSPAWGISTADYHTEGENGGRLGDFPTVFLVKEKTRQGILSALKQGRMYACRSKDEGFRRFILENFSVSDSSSTSTAVMGDTIQLNGKPKIRIRMSSSDKGNHAATVRIIRSGKLIKTVSDTTPFTVNFDDDYVEPGKQIYYRLDIPEMLVSNPIFIRFSR